MSYPWILTIHCLCISLSIWLPWIDFCISQIGKMLLVPEENMIRICLLLSLLFQYISHRIKKYFSSNVSRVELIPKLTSFRHNLMVENWQRIFYLRVYLYPVYWRDCYLFFFQMKFFLFFFYLWCLNNCESYIINITLL